MRKRKSLLIFRDEAAKQDMLTISKDGISSMPSLETSYHNLGNPLVHRVINSYDWDELVIIPTSEADIQYAKLILSRVGKVKVYGSEEDLAKYINTYIDFIPEKAGQVRMAKMTKKPLADILSN